MMSRAGARIFGIGIVVAFALWHGPTVAQQQLSPDPRETARQCDRTGEAIGYASRDRRLGAQIAFDCRLLAPLPRELEPGAAAQAQWSRSRSELN